MITGSVVYDLLTLIITLIIIIFVYIRANYSYWKKRGLINPPTTFIFGNFFKTLLQQESSAEFHKNIYKYFRSKNQLHGGFYLLWIPVYYPIDSNIIKHILITDFDHFVNRGAYYNEKSDPLSAHLLALEGNQWRNLRAKLTPTFSTGKMKMMFGTLVKCGQQLNDILDENLDKGPLDIKDMTERFGVEVIGSCAFGIDSNSIRNADNEFSRSGRVFFELTLIQGFKQFLCFVAPETMRKFDVTITKPELAEFFLRIIKETVDYREKNNIQRNDFMHLLLQLKNRGKVDDVDSLQNDDTITEEKKFSFNELAAQAFVFFIAGFETSSTTMTFCLYELSLNQTVQDKLRNEINRVLQKYNGELVYDALKEMVYLEYVINETLRKYPPIPATSRVCTKTYKVPGTDLVLEKGTKVFVPIIGLHYDPEYYTDPEEFYPERFADEDRTSRPFIPFGDGPRSCIAMRFGLMETKVGLISLLKNYKFSINSKTQVPLQFNPKSFILSAKDGVWLDYQKV